MSENEELREKIERATGQAYGTGTDAEEIVTVLDAQADRWGVVANTAGGGDS